MFFLSSKENSVKELVQILKEYGNESGQKINPEKFSIIVSAKIGAEIRIRVKSQLHIGKEGGKGKYLGLPEFFGRKKKGHVQRHC